MLLVLVISLTRSDQGSEMNVSLTSSRSSMAGLQDTRCDIYAYRTVASQPRRGHEESVARAGGSGPYN